MSVDKLQERIRKLKNPLVLELSPFSERIPPQIIQEQGDFCKAFTRYAEDLMMGLKDLVPAVKFDLSGFALLGTDGLITLEKVLKIAKKQHFHN